jgi:malate synthase
MATGIAVGGAPGERFDEVLIAEVLAFLADLHRCFEPACRDLLALRVQR